MSLKPLSLFLTGAPSGGVAGAAASLPRLLRAFADTWFRVRAVSYDLGEARGAIGAWDSATLWRDEIRAPGDVLSVCTNRDEESIIHGLADRIAATAMGPSARLEIEVRGAVAIVDASGVRWCARWWPDGTAYPLTTLRFVFTQDAVEMIVTWPVSGFPLSATHPGADRLEEGDPLDAWRQRCSTLPAIAVAPDVLGMRPASVRWSFDSGGGAALADLSSSLGSWSSALNLGAAGPDAEPRPLTHDGQVADLVAHLQRGGPAGADALRRLIEQPDHDPRVHAAIDVLRHDQTPCLVEPPALWGPIGLLAEFALAALRWDAGDFRPVTIKTVLPLSNSEIAEVERTLGLSPLGGSFDDTLSTGMARYARLLEQQAVRLVEVPIELNTSIADMALVAATPNLTFVAPPAPAVAHALAQLAHDGDGRIWALEDLVRAPLAAPEVVSAVTKLLDDRTPCDLDGEHTGELRLVAAAALAAIRASVGDATPVHVKFVQPKSERALVEAASALGSEHSWANRGQLDAEQRIALFSDLRAHGRLRSVEADLRAPVEFQRLARH